MSGDKTMIYVKWVQKLQPGNYVVQSGSYDPETGERSRLLFFPVNEMITRMRRDDYTVLVKRLRTKVIPLNDSEVPDNIRAVFEKRAAKTAAVEASVKKPKARKPKAKKTGKGA